MPCATRIVSIKIKDEAIRVVVVTCFPAGLGPSAEAGLGWLTAAAQEKTQYCSWYGRICLIYCQSVSDQARVGSWGTPLSHLPPARASSTSYTVFITRGTVGTSLLVDPNHRDRATGQLRQRPLEEYNTRFVRSLTHIIYRLHRGVICRMPIEPENLTAPYGVYHP